jgi:hypothetical protein
MKSILEKSVTGYNSVKDRSNPKEVSLLQVLSEIDHFNEVKALRDGTSKKAKLRIPAITVAANYFQGNAKSDNDQYELTGLMCLDIDGKDNRHITNWSDIKSELRKIENIAYLAYSCGGDGLFAILPISTPENYRGHYRAAIRDFAALGIIVDPSCGQITRLRILSKDENSYINHNAIPYSNLIEDVIADSKPAVIRGFINSGNSFEGTSAKDIIENYNQSDHVFKVINNAGYVQQSEDKQAYLL